MISVGAPVLSMVILQAIDENATMSFVNICEKLVSCDMGRNGIKRCHGLLTQQIN